MQILSSGKVWLEKGEIIPCFCECGRIYQPEKNSKLSECPACGRFNEAEDMPSLLRLDMVETPGEVH
jgi:hypothetical protein